MPRKRKKSDADDMWDGLVDLCVIAPVWLGPVMALLAFLLFVGVFPAMFGMAGPEIGNILGGLSQKAAPFASLFVLAAWIVGLFGKLKRRKLLDSRTGPESLRHMSWQDFELLVGEAYRRQGYVIEKRGGGGADSGIDLILRKGGETTLVQCKQWKKYKVGVKIVRELYGVMAAEKAHRGVVATCGRYTKDAKAFAEGKPLDLLDGQALWRLVEQAKNDQAAPASSDDAANAIDTRDTSDAPNKPTCPKCNSPLVQRTARKGLHAGSKFYGCSQYPKCRFIRDETSSTRT